MARRGDGRSIAILILIVVAALLVAVALVSLGDPLEPRATQRTPLWGE